MLSVWKTFLLVDVILMMISVFVDYSNAFANSQIGFWSSALVLTASMFSYSSMVKRRLADGMVVMDDDRDELDKLDDPHDLYADEEVVDSTEDIKIAIKEEKEQMKKNRRTFAQAFRDSRASLSIFRLGAYGLLFVGFLYLSKSHTLDIAVYLTALTLPMLITVFVLMIKKGDFIEKDN